MTLTRRLLIAGAAGGIIIAPTTPPFDDAWVRSGSNPILVPSVAWEQTAVFEPNLWREGGVWKMWYTGGWDDPAIGYATSSDGLTWTKYASNPVYGQGASGWAGNAGNAAVFKIGSTYWMVANNNAAPAVRIATSTDGIAWTTQASVVTLPAGKALWGNRVVWVEGVTWYMLQEAGPSVWETYLYTSTDGLTWTIANGGSPLTTLQVAAGGMYGGPDMAADSVGHKVPQFGGVYHVWYHAAPVSGNIPTDIFHATSPDRITWTQTVPNPVLTHSGSGDEVDQVGDPAVITVAGTSYLFYDGIDNGAETGAILLATAPAT